MIEIQLKHKIFNPYRGTGKIRLSIISNSDEREAETIIKGEIIPYDNAYILMCCVTISFLILWTVVAFIISTSIYTIIMVAFGWSVFPLILYLMLIWNRVRLKRYRDLFIALMRKILYPNKFNIIKVSKRGVQNRIIIWLYGI